MVQSTGSTVPYQMTFNLFFNLILGSRYIEIHIKFLYKNNFIVTPVSPAELSDEAAFYFWSIATI